MVEAAQTAWGNGIVAIASAHTEGDDFEQAARDHISNLYGYAQGDVAFKPTLAAEMQFRDTFDEALSYFVKQSNINPKPSCCAEDSGFAIKGWTAVRFVNEKIITSGSTATAMGNYFFTTPKGAEVKVEYTFGYFLDADGDLRINLHHSALPYPAQVTHTMVEAAQKLWGDGIVAIATAYTDSTDYVQTAKDHINNL